MFPKTTQLWRSILGGLSLQLLVLQLVSGWNFVHPFYLDENVQLQARVVSKVALNIYLKTYVLLRPITKIYIFFFIFILNNQRFIVKHLTICDNMCPYKYCCFFGSDVDFTCDFLPCFGQYWKRNTVQTKSWLYALSFVVLVQNIYFNHKLEKRVPESRKTKPKLIPSLT